MLSVIHAVALPVSALPAHAAATATVPSTGLLALYVVFACLLIHGGLALRYVASRRRARQRNDRSLRLWVTPNGHSTEIESLDWYEPFGVDPVRRAG